MNAEQSMMHQGHVSAQDSENTSTSKADEQHRLEETLARLIAQRAQLAESACAGSDDHAVTDVAAMERAALKSAQDTVKQHISQLTAYNDIKDIAQGLVGLIAEQRNARIVDVMTDLGFEGME